MVPNESSTNRIDLEPGDSVEAPTREKLVVAGSAAGGFGGALAAIFASLCCIGPASVALLGAGGALAAQLGPYRSALLIVSAGLVSFGLWRAYGHRILVNGQLCPIRIGRLTRSVLWIAALVWLAAALLPGGVIR